MRNQALRSCCVHSDLDVLGDLSEVDAALADHVAWLDPAVRRGVFIVDDVHPRASNHDVIDVRPGWRD